MSFHAKNFGSFAGLLDRYTDTRGYVPEAGDEQKDFTYRQDIADWKAFVERAVRATEETQRNVETWREES